MSRGPTLIESMKRRLGLSTPKSLAPASGEQSHAVVNPLVAAMRARIGRERAARHEFGGLYGALGESRDTRAFGPADLSPSLLDGMRARLTGMREGV